MLESHHYSYQDFEEDKKKHTIRLCNKCHGKQQIVQNLIRSGIQIIYIGHTLESSIRLYTIDNIL